MNVILLTSTESFTDMERFAALAALTCHANTEKEFIPADVLKRIIKTGHESILEHINLTYSIKGISRACLQELARHRHLSLSVESTRHTLRKYLNEPQVISTGNLDRHGKFGDMLFTFRNIVKTYPDMPNDELKYYLPEFWPTNLILTSNIRELRHILDLRTAPQALREFRDLARDLFNVVPEQFKYLLQDCVHEEVTMAEFTKGKWKAFYGENFHTIRQAHADDKHDYGNGELIAHVVQWHKGHDWANARLISAAPEMYELLKVWTEILAEPTLMNARKRAKELLTSIEGTEAQNE